MRSYGRKKEDRGVLADPGYCSSEASSDDQEGVRRGTLIICIYIYIYLYIYIYI